MSSSSLPGIGVFGTGAQTQIIVPFLKKAGFRVSALWGRTREEAEACARSLAIPFATHRADDVLLSKEVDLVLVLCPPGLHSQVAVKALGIGKHVAVPSPCGLSQSETLRMVQAAQYYPSLSALLVHGLRFLPAFVDMRQAISAGRVGRVSLVDVRVSSRPMVDGAAAYSWTADSHMGGGVLNGFGAQVVDLVHFLTGQKAVRVQGTLRTLNKTTDGIRGIRQISSDDLATFQMDLVDGALATVTLNGALSGFTQEVTVVGELGYLQARNADLYAKKNGPNEKEEVLSLDSDSLPSTSWTPALPQMYLKGLVRFFKHLSKTFAAKNGDALESSPELSLPSPSLVAADFEDALYVQAVIEAIRASASDKAWVKVTEVDDAEAAAGGAAASPSTY